MDKIDHPAAGGAIAEIIFEAEFNSGAAAR
jgi:hypothetical protein